MVLQLSGSGEVATLREMLDAHPEAVHSCDEVRRSIVPGLRFGPLIDPTEASAVCFIRCALSCHAQDGRTPLHWAAEGGHQDVAALLLDRGAMADAVDKGAVRRPAAVRAVAGGDAVRRLVLVDFPA